MIKNAVWFSWQECLSCDLSLAMWFQATNYCRPLVRITVCPIGNPSTACIKTVFSSAAMCWADQEPGHMAAVWGVWRCGRWGPLGNLNVCVYMSVSLCFWVCVTPLGHSFPFLRTRISVLAFTENFLASGGAFPISRSCQVFSCLFLALSHLSL